MDVFDICTVLFLCRKAMILGDVIRLRLSIENDWRCKCSNIYIMLSTLLILTGGKKLNQVEMSTNHRNPMVTLNMFVCTRRVRSIRRSKRQFLTLLIT